MKELSIEEKANAYDKVRKKIALTFGSNVAEDIFSEFEISEDEKIRKAIINIFATHKDYEVYFGVSVEDILAWLEKQGEQKPTLRERYENIAKSDWFKKTHEGMSVSVEDDKEPKWTEEDSSMQLMLMRDIEQVSFISKEGKDERIMWLNKLDDRFHQSTNDIQKSKWSDEDDENLEDIDIVLFEDKTIPKEKYWKMIDWLKSIKQRMEE